MFEHHQRAIEMLKDRFKDSPDFPALILAGSVAKGSCRSDSDVDVMFVATAGEYQRRLASGSLVFQPDGICDYPGGYVDGKVIDEAFIRDVAARGSEVARSAFIGVTVVYSRIGGLEKTIARIPNYPKEEKVEKLKSLYAHFEGARWFVGEARKRNDPFLLHRAVTNLVLFGGRMILAHNEELYRFHKYLLEDLATAPKKPAGLLENINALFADPSPENVSNFFESIDSFTDWPKVEGRWGARFMFETECNWRSGRTPIEDR
jgi:hypothetical protein